MTGLTSIQAASTPAVYHTLTDAMDAIQVLKLILQENTFGNHLRFEENVRIGSYVFDFYSPELKLAIDVESFLAESKDLSNQEVPKRLFIPSLHIHMLRFTDYQVLTDTDEILRIIRSFVATKGLC